MFICSDIWFKARVVKRYMSLMSKGEKSNVNFFLGKKSIVGKKIM